MKKALDCVTDYQLKSACKDVYLRNGARWTHGHNGSPIGSRPPGVEWSRWGASNSLTPVSTVTAGLPNTAFSVWFWTLSQIFLVLVPRLFTINVPSLAYHLLTYLFVADISALAWKTMSSAFSCSLCLAVRSLTFWHALVRWWKRCSAATRNRSWKALNIYTTTTSFIGAHSTVSFAFELFRDLNKIFWHLVFTRNSIMLRAS